MTNPSKANSLTPTDISRAERPGMTNIPKGSFTIRLSGDVSPETLDIGVLAEFLEQTKKLALAVDGNKKEIVAFKSIGAGSAVLEFSASQDRSINLDHVIHSIEHQKFDLITPQVKREFEGLVALARKHHYSLDFTTETIDRQSHITIYPSEFSFPDEEPLRISEQTIIIGEVLRVGGAVPKVEIRHLASGKLMYLTLPKDRKITKEIASRLYEVVVFDGTATWLVEDDWILEDFKIQSLNPYKGSLGTVAFRELREAAAGSWDEIDLDAFWAGLKDEESAE